MSAGAMLVQKGDISGGARSRLVKRAEGMFWTGPTFRNSRRRVLGG